MTMVKTRPAVSVRRSFGVMATCALSLAGCLRTLETEGDLQKFGAVVVTGLPSDPGKSDASATAVFFQAFSANVPNSRNQINSCQFSVVDTTTREPIGQMRAGPTITMRVGTGANALSTTLAFEQPRVRYASAGGIEYAAGDSVTLDIPGDATGFPVAVIKTRLAEPLTVQDVTVQPVGFPMAVRWNASSDTTTAVYISLKYANPPTRTYANEQVLCSLRDDGTEDIQAAALTAFHASPVALRSLTVTRWRTAIANPAEKTLLHIVSTVDVPVVLK